MADKPQKPTVVRAVVSSDGDNVTKGGRTSSTPTAAYIDLKPKDKPKNTN